MSTLVDPHICPDCRAPLDANATCTGCGLRLVGPAAAELWQHMQQADRLVEQLRTASPTPAATAAAGVVGAAPPSHPLGPPGAEPGPRRHLPAISVPVVLLAVGALCLLVAAIVFVTVAWSSLGLAAKTLILLAVTAGFAAAAVALTRRALRWAAETFWLVVAGMLTLDLAAAHAADLLGFGTVDARHVVAAVGVVLVAQAVAVGLWAGRTPLRHVFGLVPVAGIGAVLLAAGEAWTADRSAPATAVAVPLLAAAAAGIARIAGGAVRTTGYAVLVSALLSWLALVGQGLDRMSGPIDQHTWWTELTGWPLLVAAVLAAVTTLLRVPEWTRMAGAAAALVTLILFVVGPGAEVTVEVLVLSAVTVVLAVVSATAPRVWAFPAAALSALGLLGFGVWVLVRPLGTIGDLATTGPADRANLGLHLTSPDGWPAAWTAVVSALVVGVAGAGLLRHLTAPRWSAAREAAGRTWIELGPGVLALGATTALVETEPPLVVAVVAWAATTAVAAAMAVTARHHRAALVAGVVFVGYLVVVGLRLAVPSHLLAALLATALALGLAAAYARVGQELLGGLLRPLLAVASVLLGAFAASHWPYAASGQGDAAGLTVALFAAVVLIGAHAAGRDETSRRCLEGAAAVAGLVAAAYPIDTAVVAMTITILGTALALVATIRADRELFGWAAVAVLGVATLVRVVEDVRAPELYTLPAAALLVGAGVWRLRTDSAATSVRVLASGLVLGLVPSLLLALDEPVSLRGALIAAAGLAVLGAGVGLRWAAPLLAGGATTAVLAVRHLGPVVDALPRWISLGTVGVVLLLVGITWESRLRDLRAAGRYLAGLR